MSRLILCGLALTVSVLGACQRPPETPSAPEVKPRAAQSTSRVLQGTVLAPANLIGLDGASLVGLDGATLVGLDGATLVGLDGATLQGRETASGLARQLTGAGPETPDVLSSRQTPGFATAFRLLARQDNPLAGATVVLASAAGKILEPRIQAVTDAQGRFSLPVKGSGYIAVALARNPERQLVRLRAYSADTGAKPQVGVAPATTLLTNVLLDSAGPLGLTGLSEGDYKGTVAEMEKAAGSEPWPDLSRRDAVQAAVAAMAEKSPELKRRLDDLKKALSDPSYETAPADVTTQPLATARATPTPAPTPRAPRTVTVRMGAQAVDTKENRWFSTGVNVLPGDKLSFRISGAVRMCKDCAEVGPDGDPVIKGMKGYMPGFPLGALIIKVSNVVYSFTDGDGAQVQAAGPLQLGLNDDTAAEDNSGTFTIEITQK
ncbi:MAG: hypothetical protein VKP62_04685 [Candidatus Sericytochromatia bacterium]|nr:hypothetical protein [Candidatus Sericytochromatia bacterium]